MSAPKDDPILIWAKNIPSDWRGRLLYAYLNDKGLDRLPDDPSEMAGFGSWLEEKGYKENSIRSVLHPIRKAYKLAGIETNRSIEGRSDPRIVRRDAISEKDTDILLKHVGGVCSLRDQLIIKLMLFLGLTGIEISRMDIGDFYGNKVNLWPKGHLGKDVIKMVPGELLGTFVAYYREKTRTCKPDDPMFLGKKRCRLRPDVVSRIVANIMKEAGIKTEINGNRISPHSLRHRAIAPGSMKIELRLAQHFADYRDEGIPKVYRKITGCE